MKSLLAFLLLIASQKLVAQDLDTTATADTSAKVLKEVVVKGAKRPIEIQPDKTVLNLDAQPAAVGENALDVLRRSPGVVVDASESIQLNGKTGVNVLIDGRPTQLSAQDLAQLLKSVEASNIKLIELITNPSAKYDAAGGAGIINIRLKKSLTNGLVGSLTGSYVQSKHARQNATANLNWRRGNTAFFFNGGQNSGLQYVIANNDRISGNRSFTQRSIEKDFFHGSSVRAGADYSLNKKSTFGFLWMLNNRYTRMDNSSTTLIQSPSAIDTSIVTRSLAPLPTKRNSFNLNYNFSGNGTEYTMDADYTRYYSSVKNNLANAFESGSTKLGEEATLNDQQVAIKLYSLKGDLSQTLLPNLKLEAGFKLASTRTDNSLQVSGNTGGSWQADTGKTNFFRYHEDIRALYASVKGSVKKLDWQLGLRGEQTTVVGRSTDLKNGAVHQPDTSYFNLFPTVYLQYKLSEKHQLGLTANRRIDRPNYQDQNPFIYALDALNREQGNPYLMPQFTTGVELSYVYNYATSFKLGYARMTNYIEQLTCQDGKSTVMIPQNAGTKDMLSFSFSSPVRFNKIWSAYVSLTPYYHYYKVALNGFGKAEQQQGGSWAFNGYVGNTLELGRGWRGSVSGWFNFQNRATIYVSKPIGSFDLGVQKNILKEKATVKLALVDLFNTQRWEQKVTTSDLQLNTYRKWESQNITLGFSWSFGNSKIKKARERDGANEEGLNRIK